jgi:hypothetical protein
MWLSASVAAAGVVIALTLIGNKEAQPHNAPSQPEVGVAEAVPIAR